MQQNESGNACRCSQNPAGNSPLSLKDNAYFLSLPTFIQESIEQNGTVIETEEQLRKIAQALLENHQA